MISMHRIFTSNFLPILEGVLIILDKGAAHPDAGKLVHARLAPDMYDFATQVREICHYARDGAARLAGRESVTKDMVGTRESFAEMRAQVEEAIAAVKALKESDLADAETRDCSIPMRDGIRIIDMDGWRFLNGWLLPQFYFHVVTAYGILRNHGVPLGKLDYEKQVTAFMRNK